MGRAGQATRAWSRWGPRLASLCAVWLCALAPLAQGGSISDLNLENLGQPGLYLYAIPDARAGNVPREADQTHLRRRALGGVRSWKAIRDAGVVRQAFDYSCGSAALATLLSRDSLPVTEGEILHEVLSGLTDEEMADTMQAGLSLLDLKRVAERRGHRAEGYRLPPEFLTKLTRPVLVLIEPRGYPHFAVLRGVRGDRVYLADPARGNIRYPIWRFLDMWLDAEGRGVIFVVDAEPSPVLDLAGDFPSRPELLGARQLLEIRSPSVRLFTVVDPLKAMEPMP